MRNVKNNKSLANNDNATFFTSDAGYDRMRKKASAGLPSARQRGKGPGPPARASIPFLIRATIMEVRARMARIWTAVAERSGDTAFRMTGAI